MEAFGLAALEAMACGVPPVATQTGGVPDLITHGVDGFMEEVGNHEAQANRLVQLLTDEPLRHRMAAAARHSAVTRFSTELIIPQYESYYQEICESGGTRAV
jgi:glycosyltransferase involved in cell wall biosynthesis